MKKKQIEKRLLRLPLPTTAEQIPLKYRLGEKQYSGIPVEFSNRTIGTEKSGNKTITRFTGISPEGITVSAKAVVYDDFPVAEWEASFENTTTKTSPLLSEVMWLFSLAGKKPKLTYSNGETREEDGFDRFTKAIDTPVSLGTSDGAPSSNAFPFFNIDFSGRCFRLAIGWTGSWKADFSPTEEGVSISVAQRRFSTVMYPGEIFRTPSLTLMDGGRNEDESRNLWRRWYLKHVLPREMGKPLSPKLCMHVFGYNGAEFTGATEESQLEGLRTYLRNGLKPDIWWIDAGWYPCVNGKWGGTGTWRHDAERFPNGMAPISSFCHENGIRFLMWFEPERVRPDTDLAKHPEWLLSLDGEINSLFDLGNAEAREWLTEKISEKIGEYGIDVYRQDFNFLPAPYWNKYEEDNRIGALENKHVQGYLAYWDALLEKHPGLLIDSCACGGRRHDMDTLRRAFPLHYTDVGYGNHPLKQRQHRLMFEWIPYFRAHNKNWDNPDGTYGKSGNDGDVFSFHVAMAPAMTDTIAFTDPEEKYEISRKMHPIWRRCADLELRGDYYPLTECRGDAHDWYAMQFYDRTHKEGFLQVIRNVLCDKDSFTVQPKAVDQKATYILQNPETGETRTLTGEQMKKGITVTLPKRTGQIWFYQKQK